MGHVQLQCSLFFQILSFRFTNHVMLEFANSGDAILYYTQDVVATLRDSKVTAALRAIGKGACAAALAESPLLKELKTDSGGSVAATRRPRTSASDAAPPTPAPPASLTLAEVKLAAQEVRVMPVVCFLFSLWLLQSFSILPCLSRAPC
jgi:hypothetical protein